MHVDLLKAKTQFLSKLPGVEAIFLSGSRAQGKASEDSDIDLFIITRPGRIWTARFFVYIYIFIKGNMRRSGKTKNLFCPNHFITSDSLEIKEKDAYSAHLFSHNIPLHDVNNIFVQFAQKNQKWVQKFNESFSEEFLRSQNKSRNQTRVDNKTAISITQQPELNIFQKIIENILKLLQKTKIKNHPDTKLPGAKIILSDTELRFHPRPRNINWKD